MPTEPLENDPPQKKSKKKSPPDATPPRRRGRKRGKDYTYATLKCATHALPLSKLHVTQGLSHLRLHAQNGKLWIDAKHGKGKGTEVVGRTNLADVVNALRGLPDVDGKRNNVSVTFMFKEAQALYDMAQACLMALNDDSEAEVTAAHRSSIATLQAALDRQAKLRASE